MTKYTFQILLIISFRRTYKSWKITSKVIPGMKYNTNHDCPSNCLVEVDVIVKRYNIGQLGRPEPSYGVSADGQEYKCHVELQGLSPTPPLAVGRL